MHKKLDEQSAMEVKVEVKSLSSVRKIPKLNEKKIHLISIRLFNRLIIVAQQDIKLEANLEHELTPLHLFLFSNKINEQDKKSNFF